ncbi:MAG TPA: hypothetical protein PKZ99_13935, partial [Azospirillaceae bacterium]|nr:hypothetical protein [Azospirillaceae bacterium]
MAKNTRLLTGVKDRRGPGDRGQCIGFYSLTAGICSVYVLLVNAALVSGLSRFPPGKAKHRRGVGGFLPQLSLKSVLSAERLTFHRHSREGGNP